MKKSFNRSLALAAASTWLLVQGSTALAGGPGAQSDIDELKAQVQMLMEQNQQLNARLSEMEQQTSAAAIEEEVTKQMGAKSTGQSINDYVTLSGSIEGDYKLSQGLDGANKSEFILDTVELILGIQMTDWATGTIVIDYDGDDNDRFYLDEANITLGKTADFPFFLTAGKLYVPFGSYATNMIQDPLTEDLGEIISEGAIIGYEANGFTATVFSYNGMDENDIDNDTINGYGVSFAYAYEDETMGFNAGISYVTNIGDSTSLTGEIAGNIGTAPTVLDEVPGIAVNAGAKYDAFSAIIEYVAALDSFDITEVRYKNGGAEPKALNVEFAYSTSIMDKDTVFALGYQTTWEAYDLDLPLNRYIGTAAMNICAGTTVALEYYYDDFYDASNAEDNGYGFTTRLSYEF